MPRFIKDEFDAFLECRILAHGFLRLRCSECGHDKLLAAQPELVTAVVQGVVTSHLVDGAGLTAEEGHGGAVTLIQRFGSAANLNIYLHCLVLDGVYQCGVDGLPSFVEVGERSDYELHARLQTVITRLMKMLTGRGVLIDEMGQTYLAEPDADCEPSVQTDLGHRCQRQARRRDRFAGACLCRFLWQAR